MTTTVIITICILILISYALDLSSKHTKIPSVILLGLLIAITIVAVIYFVRYVQLAIAKMPTSPLLFIAPRGLITILLFVSIPVTHQISFVNESLIIQVILISAFVMMTGIMFDKKVLHHEQI